MRLDAYLIRNRIDPIEFAEKLGVSHETLRRYCRGERIPIWKILVRLDRLTKSKVTPSDFLSTAAAHPSHRLDAAEQQS
jgi:transcriptional regulator with XRE-family HTH domain